jgi:hypothetical protein
LNATALAIGTSTSATNRLASSDTHTGVTMRIMKNCVTPDDSSAAGANTIIVVSVASVIGSATSPAPCSAAA